MEIRLVSEDTGLFKLCGEVLTEITKDQPACLTVATAQTVDSGAALYIWDFQPRLSAPAQKNWTPSGLVVLAHRRDIPLVKEAFGIEPTIVLKPVSRATLSALLSFALSNQTVPALRVDRDKIFQCLIEANLKLQEYDQNRTNFLARIVHDFRAPLTALNGYCGLLLGEPLGPLSETQTEIIQRMQQSIRRLSRMASGMLQLSAGRPVNKRPDLQKADIRKCLDEALQEIRHFGDEKRIAIRAELGACDGDLHFETAQMVQVFVNILDNACRFTPKGGSIDIQGYRFFWERRGSQSIVSSPKERRSLRTMEPNSYRIDITDSGSPIPDAHLQNIFEEYTSYSGSRDRTGGGLGLAICRMIVGQHDGWVWAENTVKGPMFSLVLPIRRFDSINAAVHKNLRTSTDLTTRNA